LQIRWHDQAAGRCLNWQLPPSSAMPGPPLTSGSGAQVRLAAQFCEAWSDGITGQSMPARPGAVRLSVWAALQDAAGGRESVCWAGWASAWAGRNMSLAGAGHAAHAFPHTPVNHAVLAALPKGLRVLRAGLRAKLPLRCLKRATVQAAAMDGQIVSGGRSKELLPVVSRMRAGSSSCCCCCRLVAECVHACLGGADGCCASGGVAVVHTVEEEVAIEDSWQQAGLATRRGALQGRREDRWCQSGKRACCQQCCRYCQ
jgi:hypothetical protein